MAANTRNQEKISRAAMLALSSNYKSTPEALMELIDNPIDYRGDRDLEVHVIMEPGNDRILVRDIGGEGMNEDTLREWLHWGGGQSHRPGDIGQFHVGGKLACIFLAESLQIFCRRAGENVVWHFDDPAWGTRTEIEPLRIVRRHVSEMSWVGRLPDDGIGFVQVTLEGLKRRRSPGEHLKVRIADSYPTLIESGKLKISVNDELVYPSPIPWLTEVKPLMIPRKEVYKDVTVWGKVGALDRQFLRTSTGDRKIQPGLRTNFNGRTITKGEEFGHNLSGRGSTRRLYGELSISGSGLLPTQQKSGWDKDSEEWRAIATYVRPFVNDIYRALNRLSRRTKQQTQSNFSDRAEASQTSQSQTDQARAVNRLSESQLSQGASIAEQIRSATGKIESSLRGIAKMDIARTEDEELLVDYLVELIDNLPAVEVKAMGS